MELIELVLATAIGEAGEYQDVRLSKEDANVILDMLTAQQKWISVKDKLPEDESPVLVWESQGFAYVDNFINGDWNLGKPTMAIITHWMPLPEPPKEEEPK